MASDTSLFLSLRSSSAAPPRYLEIKLGRGVLDPSILQRDRDPRLRLAVRLLRTSPSPDPFGGIPEGKFPEPLPAIAILDAAALSPKNKGENQAQLGLESPSELTGIEAEVFAGQGIRHVVSHASRVIGPAPNWQGQRLRVQLPEAVVQEIESLVRAQGQHGDAAGATRVKFLTLICEVWVEGHMKPLAVCLFPVQVAPPPPLAPATEENYLWVDYYAFNKEWAPNVPSTEAAGGGVVDKRLGQIQMAIGFVDITESKGKGTAAAAPPPIKLQVRRRQLLLPWYTRAHGLPCLGFPTPSIPCDLPFPPSLLPTPCQRAETHGVGAICGGSSEALAARPLESGAEAVLGCGDGGGFARAGVCSAV